MNQSELIQKPNLSLIAFTKNGAYLCTKLCKALSDRYSCHGYTMEKFCQETELLSWEMPETPFSESIYSTKSKSLLEKWTSKAFVQGDFLIFISACGIAVRSIAPFLQDKAKDPGVVVVDEMGHFAVSLLSGHLGGANKLAKEVAKEIGAQAVISTATDLNNVFAVDMWAKENQLFIKEKDVAKKISAALLEGISVGFVTPFNRIPQVLSKENSYKLGICVDWNFLSNPFAVTLHLVPKRIVLGIGCRKGTTSSSLIEFVLKTLEEKGIPTQAICKVCSIDLKQSEPGLLEFCADQGWKLETFSANELVHLEGNFSGSSFVKEVTGVDNVCERSAVAGCNGDLIFSKVKGNGITLAAAGKSVALIFHENQEVT